MGIENRGAELVREGDSGAEIADPEVLAELEDLTPKERHQRGVFLIETPQGVVGAVDMNPESKTYEQVLGRFGIDHQGRVVDQEQST